MNVGAASGSYQCACGAGHPSPALCPGDLPATGAELPGRRLNVETARGNEAIGILLAPSNDLWRARIMTLPNVLWMAPGGRSTLKFAGATREDAEAQAVLFIEKHLLATKNGARRNPGGLANAPRPQASTSAAPAARGLVAAPPRVMVRLPVRYGLDGVVARGMTVNLSCEGMFVGIGSPVDSGRSLLLHLDLNGHGLSLRGLVMWNRVQGEVGRPVGMGVLLSDPPGFYQDYVKSLM